jgi:hypothetical protein
VGELLPGANLAERHDAVAGINVEVPPLGVAGRSVDANPYGWRMNAKLRVPT